MLFDYKIHQSFSECIVSITHVTSTASAIEILIQTQVVLNQEKKVVLNHTVSNPPDEEKQSSFSAVNLKDSLYSVSVGITVALLPI